MLIPSFWYRVFSGILIVWTYYRTKLVDEGGKPVEYEPNLNQLPYLSQRLRSSDSGFSEAETVSTDQWTDQILDTETSLNSKSTEQFKDTEMEDNLTSQFGDDLREGGSIEQIVEVQGPDMECNNLDDNIPDFFPIDVHTQLELLNDLNTDIESIIKTAMEILDDKNDASIKNGRDSLKDELDKIKDISRETRTSFKKATRKNFDPSIAESLIQNPVLCKNQELIKSSQELLVSFNQLIKNRGLNLGPIVGKKPKKIWPVFTGQTLPTLSNFLAEVSDLCIEQGLPISNRGSKLYTQVKGPAKIFLKSQLDDLNPTYETIKQALMLGFGKPEQVEELLTKLHRQLPIIPANANDLKIIKEHKNIADAMLQQYKNWELHKQGESPLTMRYVNTIMDKLPKYHLFHLYSESNFANLSHRSKFDCIVLELQKLYNFANNCFIFQTQTSQLLPHNPLDNNFSMPPPSY